MENFELSLFLSITDMNAASGLVYHDDKLYLISDNSNSLTVLDLETNTSKKMVFYEKAEENMAKDVKPDFESITLYDDFLFLFGSGSTTTRNNGLQLDLNNFELNGIDLTPNYNFIKQKFSIADTDFNIEGAFFASGYLYFVQRGNGANRVNGIFRIDLETFNSSPDADYFPVTLPEINGVAATFTDAIVVSDNIFFLATAEDVASTYEDGKIMGSMIGKLNTTTCVLEQHMIISEHQKFEGITLYNQSLNEIEFLLCEDNDSEEMVSGIYSLRIYL